MTATEYVILVDEQNNEVGQAEKLLAHQQNLLHRAFSVFIFRQSVQNQSEWELLIQQRALHKYHSPGLWTNTCCSHPRQGEKIVAAGERRLKEEFGIEAELVDRGWFYYNAHFSNGLSEHEIDHVLVGVMAANDPIKPDPNEIAAYRWVTMDQLKQEMVAQPEKFTLWLGKALERVKVDR